jgi:hypothetical protein
MFPQSILPSHPFVDDLRRMPTATDGGLAPLRLGVPQLRFTAD